MSVHLLGIRHHGPGSARNIKAYLEKLKPDVILVEGPPEGDSLLSYVVHENMKPPVALLAYIPDQPEKAVFYPFAEFSPEWQAIYYGISMGIPVRFFDLPLSHSFALTEKEGKEASSHENLESDGVAFDFSYDPFDYFAQVSGLENGESWWEKNFESRLRNEEIFEAVSEAVSELRAAVAPHNSHREQLREAWMRKSIREAQKEKFENIAVICGAWHVPALKDLSNTKEDTALLKGLAKTKIACTYIPWSYNRLSYKSGYGAGIFSPGWYHHLWLYPHDDGTRWMSGIAALLREKNMDVSVAHVIEAVRLSNALAALREYPKAGLDEMNESVRAVMGFGEDALMQIIKEELIISDQIGEVPDSLPKVPLLTDLEKTQKKLRLSIEAGRKEIELDLRQPNDLAKSILLRRMVLLGIAWGELREAQSKGTFKENWILQWQPEFSIRIIEQGVWGNTVEEACENFLNHHAKEEKDLVKIAGLLQRAIPADLARSVELLIRQLDQLAASSNDILALIQSLPSIAQASRYGNVRKTDLGLLTQICSAMITRISISLPLACAHVDEQAAQSLLDDIAKMQEVVQLLQLEEESRLWYDALGKLVSLEQTHALISGYACRLLFNQSILGHEEISTRIGYTLSMATDPLYAAYWIEGFLRGSGSILLLDQTLWNILYEWVSNLKEEVFVQLLPLLRRTFSNFSTVERRKLGEKAKNHQGGSTDTVQAEENFDPESALKGIPLVLQLLGFKPQS